MGRRTRRTVLKLLGASAVAATVPVVHAEDGWRVAETPVDSTLRDVKYTTTTPHAAGNGGLIIERTAEGWEVVLRGGPTGNGNDLYGTDATDDGTSWNAIGIEDADASLYGLDGDAEDDVHVSGGNATVFEYDGSQWRSESLGDADLIDVETDDDGYAVVGGGTVFEYDGGEWRRNDTPTGENLTAVVRSESEVDIAVGAGGEVIER